MSVEVPPRAERFPAGPAAAARRVSGTDVARAAGVSQRTVSRVVNNFPQVSPDVRRRVQRAIEDLGYRPNSAARSLLLGRTRTIGLLTVGSTAYGPASLALATERAVRAAAYGLLVVNTVELDAESVETGLSALLDQGVDAVVVNEPTSTFRSRRHDLAVPVLSLSGPLELSATELVVASDEAGGVAAAVRHLLDLGHATVHHVGGPTEWPSARRRAQAWRAALEDAGREVPPVLTGDWSPASGYAAGRELARRPGVTAIFAAGDHLAFGVARALQEAGRRVPADVSLIGFDDVPEAAFMTRALTTVRQDLVGTAARGVEIVQAIEGRLDAGALETIPTRLVLRETTGPPPTPPPVPTPAAR
ncbi:LacI family DNA-binding transcriptional regulator [Pengzhenrongella sicca]|uniref:LacI family DNA-binding transcriptional regulator n=1 Tax=Pengzhenrongella sicca TaxID=2819238 RepID=A0A8A4ZGM5_9MICO|nr:LacI family DNA-binding transcriptional regulator [Pengzhenrongella sicca]QTE31192.1 LacI family DNA-binding transcriptional regulator [Pengzhenrongella sicca]